MNNLSPPSASLLEKTSLPPLEKWWRRRAFPPGVCLPSRQQGRSGGQSHFLNLPGKGLLVMLRQSPAERNAQRTEGGRGGEAADGGVEGGSLPNEFLLPSFPLTLLVFFKKTPLSSILLGFLAPAPPRLWHVMAVYHSTHARFAMRRSSSCVAGRRRKRRRKWGEEEEARRRGPGGMRGKFDRYGSTNKTGREEGNSLCCLGGRRGGGLESGVGSQEVSEG